MLIVLTVVVLVTVFLYCQTKKKRCCERFLFQMYMYEVTVYVVIVFYRCSVEFKNKAQPGFQSDIISDEVCFL